MTDPVAERRRELDSLLDPIRCGWVLEPSLSGEILAAADAYALGKALAALEDAKQAVVGHLQWDDDLQAFEELEALFATLCERLEGGGKGSIVDRR